MAKITPVKPVLLQLYGYPGAGKTYFARQFCEQFQAAHVQDNRIRFELFESPQYDKQENDVISQLMDYMATEFLNAGISVVYDTNAMRTNQRHTLRELARKSKAQPLLVWFQIDPDSAYLRTTKRDRRRSDDKFTAAIDRPRFDSIAGTMQNPLATEDYIVVSGKHVFKTQMSAIVKRLHELNLISSDDAMSQLVKPGLVNLVPGSQPTIRSITDHGGRVDLSRRNITIR